MESVHFILEHMLNFRDFAQNTPHPWEFFKKLPKVLFDISNSCQTAPFSRGAPFCPFFVQKPLFLKGQFFAYEIIKISHTQIICAMTVMIQYNNSKLQACQM